MRPTVLFSTIALLAGCAAAVAELGFLRVDANDDGRVSNAEFDNAVAALAFEL